MVPKLEEVDKEDQQGGKHNFLTSTWLLTTFQAKRAISRHGGWSSKLERLKCFEWELLKDCNFKVKE